MKKRISRIGIALLGFVMCVWVASKFQPNAAAGHLPEPQEGRPAQTVLLASPGRVEGRSDTINVGAAVDGVVDSIRVHEGQRVVRGDVLAEIGCGDLRWALQAATSEAESFRQARARLLRGSREEERQAAAQKTAAARAVVQQTSAQLERMSKLRDAAAISRAAYDQALRDDEVANAELKHAMRAEELVNAPPLPEDVARAEADLETALNRVQLAQEKVEKCVVHAPADGTILRVNLREGESFTVLAPRPLFTLADVSGRRVKAEVDEQDIGKVSAGQHVLVTSDAFPGKEFPGTVLRVAPVMGRKAVSTGDPAEKSDRDILEVTAALDRGATALPLGLRVTVQFIR